jgi:hypothetical protein
MDQPTTKLPIIIIIIFLQKQHHVSQLVFSGDERERYCLGFHKITQEVMSNIDVLGPRVLNWILGDVDSTGIITVDNHSILRESVVA